MKRDLETDGPSKREILIDEAVGMHREMVAIAIEYNMPETLLLATALVPLSIDPQRREAKRMQDEIDEEAIERYASELGINLHGEPTEERNGWTQASIDRRPNVPCAVRETVFLSLRDPTLSMRRRVEIVDEEVRVTMTGGMKSLIIPTGEVYSISYTLHRNPVAQSPGAPTAS